MNIGKTIEPMFQPLTSESTNYCEPVSGSTSNANPLNPQSSETGAAPL